MQALVKSTFFQDWWITGSLVVAKLQAMTGCNIDKIALSG